MLCGCTLLNLFPVLLHAILYLYFLNSSRKTVSVFFPLSLPLSFPRSHSLLTYKKKKNKLCFSVLKQSQSSVKIVEQRKETCVCLVDISKLARMVVNHLWQLWWSQNATQPHLVDMGVNYTIRRWIISLNVRSVSLMFGDTSRSTVSFYCGITGCEVHL